jgi:hypothetical protein
MNDGAAEIASTYGDQAFALKDPQRFANGREAHAKAGLQLFLSGQCRVLAYLSIENLFSQF